MSTSATLSQNTVATPSIKNETLNFAVVGKLDGEGRIIAKSVKHTQSENYIELLESPAYGTNPVLKDEDKEVILYKQAVIKPSVGTLAGFEELITDPEERLNIINKGISSKFNQKIRTTLIELDENGGFVFVPVEPTFDATSLVQEPALRTNMTQLDKARKTLSMLPADVREALLAQFAAMSAAAQ